MATRRTLGSVSLPILGAGALALLGAAAWFNLPTRPVAAVSQRPQPSMQVTLSPLAGLGALGLTPEVLAVAGVDGSGATRVIHDLSTYLATSGPSLAQALTAANQAERAASRARRGEVALQRPDPSAASIASTAQSAIAARAAAVDAAFSAATASLTPEQIATIRRVQGNKLKWEVPAKYLVADRTDAQWLALRDALSHTRQASDAGRAPASAAVELIAAADAEAAVAAAHMHLAALPAVRQAVATVTGTQ